MAELKTCPFCGGPARVKVVDDKIRYKRFYPSCYDRHCLGRNNSRYYCTEQQEIEAWNRRADDGTN